MLLGWLMLWLITLEIRGSIPYCDTMVMPQDLQMVYMPMGGLQVAHMLKRTLQLSYVPWGRRVMHIPRGPYLVPYAYILHPYDY